MAGLIRLNENQEWSVSGWVFDQVLRISREHLPTADSSRILELVDRAETGLNYISLENLSPREIKIFREALDSAYQEMLNRGSDSFGDPEFYPGFMKKFEELLEMIPRTQ